MTETHDVIVIWLGVGGEEAAGALAEAGLGHGPAAGEVIGLLEFLRGRFDAALMASQQGR